VILDSPQPGLRGSHHLPPYSILCVTPRHSHPNGFYSRDSQGGVPKLLRFGLLGLRELITAGSDLGLGWGLKQTRSSPQELFNSVLHSICTHWDWVDSRIFVVGSQTVSLTLGPSFAHNLCCRCPNGSCEAIFDIYTSRPFQRYKEPLKAKCFSLCCRALKLCESRRTSNSHFWEYESHPHTCFKVGLRHLTPFGMGPYSSEAPQLQVLPYTNQPNRYTYTFRWSQSSKFFSCKWSLNLRVLLFWIIKPIMKYKNNLFPNGGNKIMSM